MKTHTTKPSEVTRAWWLIDAQDMVLGRLATEVARLLRGKHKTQFATHIDTGDFVVIVNAAGVRLTGTKMDNKFAYRHSGYPGGLRAVAYGKLAAERPEMMVEKAVRGMLPHNRLGRAMAKKLKVYRGSDHPHTAQSPKPWPAQPEPSEVGAGAGAGAPGEDS